MSLSRYFYHRHCYEWWFGRRGLSSCRWFLSRYLTGSTLSDVRWCYAVYLRLFITHSLLQRYANEWRTSGATSVSFITSSLTWFFTQDASGARDVSMLHEGNVCQGPGIDVPSTRERFSGTRGGVSGTKERSWTRDVSETRERCVRDQRKLGKGPGRGSQEPWWGYQGPGWGYQWPKEGCHETGSGTRERCVRDKVEVVMEQGSGISPHQKTLYVSCYSK